MTAQGVENSSPRYSFNTAEPAYNPDAGQRFTPEFLKGVIPWPR
jgi:hypothetical protein